MKTRIENIRCPRCDLAQPAEVWLPDLDPTNPTAGIMPFPIYSHFCAKCDYLILESEWNTVTDPTTTPEPAAGVADTPHVVTEDDGEPD